MRIQQGDQYAIPIKIKSGEDIITPDNCTDARVKIDKTLLDYSSGGITFNATDNTWCFPLTEEMSFGYDNIIHIQIAVKFDDDFIYSPLQQIDVGNSLIKEFWDAD